MFLSFLCCIFSVYHFILLYYIFKKKNYYCVLHNFFFIALECGAKTAARLLKDFTRGGKITAAAKGLAEWKKESRQCISPGPGSWGYRACQKLWSLITEEMLSYFFFSHLITYPQIIQPIC